MPSRIRSSSTGSRPPLSSSRNSPKRSVWSPPRSPAHCRISRSLQERPDRRGHPVEQELLALQALLALWALRVRRDRAERLEQLGRLARQELSAQQELQDQLASMGPQERSEL